VGRADYHGYLGHSSHVTNARFSYNDEFLITVGGGDRCAFQWRHYEADEGDEEMTSEVEEEVLTSVEDYEDFSKTNQVVQMVMTGHVNGIPQYMPLSSLEAKPSREIPARLGTRSRLEAGVPAVRPRGVRTGRLPTGTRRVGALHGSRGARVCPRVQGSRYQG
jgi:uncharacterized protein (UPF0297 family)